MHPLLAVTVGGALGSAARYLVSRALLGATPAIPLGTLVINVVGSFVLGIVLAPLPDQPPSTVRIALGAGFCGGFTTFSTLAWELMSLSDRGAAGRAGIYAGMSLGLGLVAVIAGTAVGRAMTSR